MTKMFGFHSLETRSNFLASFKLSPTFAKATFIVGKPGTAGIQITSGTGYPILAKLIRTRFKIETVTGLRESVKSKRPAGRHLGAMTSRLCRCEEPENR
jgi:hypothetical protein